MIAQLALVVSLFAHPALTSPDDRLPDGPYERFHEDGSLAAKGTVENGVRVGKWTYYAPGGVERASGKLVKGRRHGSWTFLHANGKTETKGKYSRGKRIAKWSFRDADGKKQAERSGEPGIGQARTAGAVQAIGGFCGQREGAWLLTWPDGAPMLFGEYTNGLPTGTWRFWQQGADAGAFTTIDTGRPAWDPAFWDLEEPAALLALLKEAARDDKPSPSPLRYLNEVSQLRAVLFSESDSEAVDQDDIYRLLSFLEQKGTEASLQERALELVTSGLEAAGAEIPEGGAGAIRNRYALWLLVRGDKALRQSLTNLGPSAAELWLLPTDAEVFLGAPPEPTLEAKPAAGPRLGGKFGGFEAMRKARSPKVVQTFDKAMAWLAENQGANGLWPEERFEIGATASALYAFVGDRNLPDRGPYRETVERGLAALINAQDEESGALHSSNSVDPDYEHALATYTLAEAFYHTRDISIGFALVAAIDHCLANREPDGLWHSPNRSPTTGPVLFALAVALESGWKLPDDLKSTIDNWLLANPVTVSTSRKSLSPDAGPAATSERLFLRLVYRLSKDLLNPALQASFQLPERSAKLDLFELQFRSLIALQVGSKHWKGWNAYMTEALSSTQNADGSWDRPGRSGIGRITTTAQNAITLEVMYRYGNLLRWR